MSTRVHRHVGVGAQTYQVLPVLTPVPDSTVLITDKFRGPSGAERVLGSVHVWLAEAINTLRDNRDTLTAKVRAGGCGGRGGVPQMWPRAPPGPCGLPQVIQGCGNPKVNPQGPGPEEKQRWQKLELPEKPPTGALEKLVRDPRPARPCGAAGGGRGARAAWARAPSGLTAAPQVSEARAQLRDAQDFWVSLPGTLCSEKMAMSIASDDRCWNGVAKGR